MAIKVVTDSGSDLPLEVAKELGITVVPVYIYFGEKAYKDGVDIGSDELYKRLVEGPIYPTTTQPMPADFAKAYSDLSKDADAIVSIHLPTKVSGTYNAALQGVEIAKPKCEVHVVDGFSVSVGLGIIATAAARVAKAGGKLVEVLEETEKAISQTQIRGLLDTLHYLLKGGRITKSKALVGTLLKVKPILTMREGELVQAGMARSYAKGIEQLFEFVKSYPNLQEVAIAHSTVPEEAKVLKKRIASVIDEERIQMSRIGAGLGVHGGPGTLIVAARSG
ncbi:MAG: DegV family protein [Dehalococcoidia bacterium]|nr:MAG: DegV family protein [Dehalococcoidia bacterium]